MPLSSSISTGLVKGRFGSGVVLGPNGEELLIPARGRIEFVGMTPFSQFPVASPDPITMTQPKAVGVLDSEGYLCTEDTSAPGGIGPRMVLLQVPNDPGSTVQGWTWLATPRFVNENGTRVHNSMDPFTFDLPFGAEPFDLVNAVPVPESVGIGTEQAIILAASAQAAATSAAGSAEAAAEAARAVVGALPSKADLIDGKVPADQLPPAVGVTDEVVAPLVDMPETAAAIDARVAGQVAGKLDAEVAAVTYEAKGAATSAFAPALQKIASGTNDVHMLIVGDSTTAKYTGLDQTGVQVDTWGERLPASLAAQYPTHTISTRWYNDSAGTYAAAEIIAGTGSRTIHLWMGAIAGKDTGYPLMRWASLLVTPASAGGGVDLLMVAHGHNENSIALASGIVAGTDPKLRDRYVANVEQMRGYLGYPPTVLTSQNPAPSRPGFSERRADIYRTYAAERGYGFVDVCAAFYADGRSIDNTLVTADGLHPSNAGAIVWLNAMLEPLSVRNMGAQALSPATPAFNESRRNFLVNSNFTEWPLHSTGTTGWKLTNVTDSQETTNATYRETKAYSAKLVKTTAGATAKLVQDISAQAKLLAGKDVTFAVRMYIPTGTPQTAAQISLNDGPALIMSDQWKPINDVWFWKIITIRCRSNMTVLTCNIQLDPSGTGSNETIYVDRASLVIGKYPADSF